MSEEPKNYGLTRAQWRQLYEDGKWKELFVQTAIEVSTCPHARPEDRESAIGLFGVMVRNGTLAETDWPGDRRLAQVVRDNQLAMLLGPPLTIDQNKRDQCKDRVTAMRIVGEMVLSFAEQPSADPAAMLRQLLEGPVEPKLGEN